MKPLIVQSDFTIMVSSSEELFEKIKEELIKFAEIVQSPDDIYIYKITDLSIWNAISMDIPKDWVTAFLQKYSKYDVPTNVLQGIDNWYSNYGRVTLSKENEKSLKLTVTDQDLQDKIKSIKNIGRVFQQQVEDGFLIHPHFRGEIKHFLMQEKISVKDEIGYSKGDELKFKIRDKHKTKGFDIEIRDYQEDSSQAVYSAGNGTVVLPCGAGKTIVGIRFAELCQTSTLIVTNSSASVNQWKQSLLEFTDLKEDQVSCYTADNKVIAPVTICTYNMLAYRYKGEFIHFNKLIKHNWGAFLLDEVHLMPANMFRIVASFQSLKRLALTATFVREDCREKDIFTLVGPKRYDKPWKDLEARGYIARVSLKELRIPLTSKEKEAYLTAKDYQEKLSISTMSTNKVKVMKQLLKKHKDDKVLIIGQYTEQLEEYGKLLGIPVVHGAHSDEEREHYYSKMRNGEINQLIASSIANAALDIPGINVVAQISFQGGSRNEEAQRVGRATRPKEKPAYFYTLVSKDTKEEDQNFNRQQFLTSEGYKYEIQEVA